MLFGLGCVGIYYRACKAGEESRGHDKRKDAGYILTSKKQASVCFSFSIEPFFMVELQNSV